MNIGKALKELRVSRKLSQQEMGRIVGRSAAIISHWENGTTIPRIDSIKKLCSFFGISPSFLLLSTIEKTDLPKEQQILYETMVIPLLKVLKSKSWKTKDLEE